MTFPIPDAALAHHTAVLGKTGSGKTTTAKGIVEHLVAAGARICILDPIKSDWWGLTSSTDGKRAGLPFHILGGPRGHVPLHAASGKAIAEIVANGTLPLSILDMADFPAGGLAKFFIDFAPTLLRKARGVVHLVMEEAHEFAPKERLGIGDENMLLHHAKRLATAGRSKGIRLIVLTQRTQALHNAVLGSCETMIAHRLTAPADQKPVVDWLKANVEKEKAQEISGSLSSLKTGTAWVCSGEAGVFSLVQFPRIKTYDNSATPTGNGDMEDVRTAPVDVDKLRSIVGDAAKEAEANDPKLLKAEIARLTAEIAKKPTAPPAAPIDLEAIRCETYAAGDKAGYERAFSGFKPFVAHLVNASDHLVSANEAMVEDLRKTVAWISDNENKAAATAPKSLPPPSRAPVAQRTEPRNSTPKVVGSNPAGRANIDAPLQRIVDSIRWWNVFGVQAPTHAQAAFIANYVHGSGTWNRYLSSLRTMGLIEPRGDLKLTSAGADVANDPSGTPNGEHLRSIVLGKIDAPLARILKPVLDAYPRGLTHEQAAAAANYEPGSGTWNRYLSSLRSLDAIEGRGELKAQGWLFP